MTSAPTLPFSRYIFLIDRYRRMSRGMAAIVLPNPLNPARTRLMNVIFDPPVNGEVVDIPYWYSNMGWYDQSAAARPMQTPVPIAMQGDCSPITPQMASVHADRGMCGESVT